MLIRAQRFFGSSERAHQHQQTRLWQVKIGQHRVDRTKRKSWIDKDIGIAALLTKLIVPGCGKFQGSYCSGADRDDPSALRPCSIEHLCGVRRNAVAFDVKTIRFYLLMAQRLKSSQANVQRQLRGFNTSLCDAIENLFRKMQPCRRCGHRSEFAGEDGLIPVSYTHL